MISICLTILQDWTQTLRKLHKQTLQQVVFAKSGYVRAFEMDRKLLQFTDLRFRDLPAFFYRWHRLLDRSSSCFFFQIRCPMQLESRLLDKDFCRKTFLVLLQLQAIELVATGFLPFAQLSCPVEMLDSGNRSKLLTRPLRQARAIRKVPMKLENAREWARAQGGKTRSILIYVYYQSSLFFFSFKWGTFHLKYTEASQIGQSLIGQRRGGCPRVRIPSVRSRSS